METGNRCGRDRDRREEQKSTVEKYQENEQVEQRNRTNTEYKTLEINIKKRNDPNNKHKKSPKNTDPDSCH